MKHLKTFESLTNNIIDEIRDILLDITDDGFKIDIKIWSFQGHDRLDIVVHSDKSFSWDSVSKSVLDLKSHLSDRYHLNRIWSDLAPGYSIGGTDRPEIYPENELNKWSHPIKRCDRGSAQYTTILGKIVLNFEKI